MEQKQKFLPTGKLDVGIKYTRDGIEIAENLQSIGYVLFHTRKDVGQHLLTSSSCHPKIFVKEFSYFLMPCHQHGLGVNLLVQR